MKQSYSLQRLLGFAGIILAVYLSIVLFGPSSSTRDDPDPKQASSKIVFCPRQPFDSAGFGFVVTFIPPWSPDDSLERIAKAWHRIGYRLSADMDEQYESMNAAGRIQILMLKATMMNFENEPDTAYQLLEECRTLAENDPELARVSLYSIIAFQGVTALRRGETDNCVMCRGESSCILPIASAAIHTKPLGSRLAIKHFTEYLERFPDDLEIRWLLNVAHMTLGEHPDGMDTRFLVPLDRYRSSEHGIGKFRDVGQPDPGAVVGAFTAKCALNLLHPLVGSALRNPNDQLHRAVDPYQRATHRGKDHAGQFRLLRVQGGNEDTE